MGVGVALAIAIRGEERRHRCRQRTQRQQLSHSAHVSLRSHSALHQSPLPQFAHTHTCTTARARTWRMATSMGVRARLSSLASSATTFSAPSDSLRPLTYAATFCVRPCAPPVRSHRPSFSSYVERWLPRKYSCGEGSGMRPRCWSAAGRSNAMKRRRPAQVWVSRRRRPSSPVCRGCPRQRTHQEGPARMLHPTRWR